MSQTQHNHLSDLSPTIQVPATPSVQAPSIQATLELVPQVDRVVALYEQVRKVLLGLGKAMSGVAIKQERLKRADCRALDHGERWITAFIKVRIGNYDKARALVSEKTWQGYAAMGVTKGAYELDQLNSARRELLADWHARPNLFRRVKDKTQEPKSKPKRKKKSKT